AELTKYNNDKKTGEQNIAESGNLQTISFTSYFNYVTNLKGSHNISARLLATGFQQTRSEVYHRTGNANLGLELNYNYNEKYFASIGTALVHSAKLAQGN